MYEHVKNVGVKAEVARLKTQHGVKDTYFEHFLERVFRASKKKRGAAGASAVREEAKTLPKNVFSPIFRLKGMSLVLTNVQESLICSHLL